MDTDDIAGNLRALATASQYRTKIGRVRELYPEIENAKAAGVSLEKVLETLNEKGLDMSMLTFKSCLHRLRKEAQNQKKTLPAALPPAGFTPKKNEASAPETPTELEEENQQVEGQANLTSRERREQRANQFIKPEATNPLLKNLTNKAKGNKS